MPKGKRPKCFAAGSRVMLCPKRDIRAFAADDVYDEIFWKTYLYVESLLRSTLCLRLWLVVEKRVLRNTRPHLFSHNAVITTFYDPKRNTQHGGAYPLPCEWLYETGDHIDDPFVEPRSLIFEGT